MVNFVMYHFIYGFIFCHLSYLMSTALQKQMILLTYHQEVNSSLMLCYTEYINLLTSFRHIHILSSHIITGRVSMVVQKGILRERAQLA